MKETEYIKSKLRELRQIPLALSYEYAYDEDLNFHIVEIEPYSVINNDSVFDVIFGIQTEIYNNYPECNFIYSKKSPCNNMDGILDQYSSTLLTRRTRMRTPLSFCKLAKEYIIAETNISSEYNEVFIERIIGKDRYTWGVSQEYIAL